ncbi:MAG: hypothetical protein ACK4VI_09220 [Alphaproteobacteria bacterium]
MVFTEQDYKALNADMRDQLRSTLVDIFQKAASCLQQAEASKNFNISFNARSFQSTYSYCLSQFSNLEQVKFNDQFLDGVIGYLGGSHMLFYAPEIIEEENTEIQEDIMNVLVKAMSVSDFYIDDLSQVDTSRAFSLTTFASGEEITFNRILVLGQVLEAAQKLIKSGVYPTLAPQHLSGSASRSSFSVGDPS